MKWEKVMEGTFVSKKKDRVFRLQLDRRGVLGIGKAYYLSSKLDSESEFSSIKDIVISDDNHGLQRDIYKDQEYFVFEEKKHMDEVIKIAEKLIKAMY